MGIRDDIPQLPAGLDLRAIIVGAAPVMMQGSPARGDLAQPGNAERQRDERKAGR